MNGKRMLCWLIGLCLLVSLYGCAVPVLMPKTGGSGSDGSAEWMETESSESPDLTSTMVGCFFQRSPMTDTYSWDLDGGEFYADTYPEVMDPWPWTADNAIELLERYRCWNHSLADHLQSAILFVAKTDLPASEGPPSFWPPTASAEAYKLHAPSETGRAEWEVLLASWGIVKGEHYSPTTEVPPYFEQQPRENELWDASLFDFYQIDVSLNDILWLCWRAYQEGYFVFVHLPSTRSMEAMRLDRLGW